MLRCRTRDLVSEWREFDSSQSREQDIFIPASELAWRPPGGARRSRRAALCSRRATATTTSATARSSASCTCAAATSAASFPEEVWRRLNYAKLESTMYKARKKMEPPAPASLQDYGRLLEDPQYLGRYALTEDGRPFYRGVLGPEGERCAVFVSDALAELLVASRWWFVDHGLGVRPVSPPSAQLLVVSALHQEHLYPAVFVLMELKTAKAYEALCEHIRSWVGDHSPDSIVTDFDPVLQAAFEAAFPRSSVQGAWYYYAQWVGRQAVALGLQPHLCESTAARAVLKMCMVLPLLGPALLAPGLEACVQYARTVGRAEQLAALFAAVRARWLGPSTSVHDCPQRTNNHHDNYKRHFRKRMGLHCKNAWSFTDALRAEERVCRLDLTRTRNGMSVTRTRRARWLLEDGKVLAATAALLSGKISVFKFLQRTSAAVNAILNKALFHRRAELAGTIRAVESEHEEAFNAEEDELSDWQGHWLAGEDLGEGEDEPECCAMCLARPPNVQLEPCSHTPACSECWEQWQQHSDICPVCGQEAHGSVTILLP
ncbi:uncharacterized protein LOC134531174 isoform X2 [Bacillus rossius redtenbacheri]|uniref:uncharacterized protein LOC134531174 isoform X2 n=1 Tax=Bacillus rossius redtenbacheri TaxID=93214 RepID=UPI002FDDACFE